MNQEKQINRQMPILRPIPIHTHGKPLGKRVSEWLFGIRRWEVIEDFIFAPVTGPKILIPRGFAFDGASIPRMFWWLLNPTGILLIPGLIHDFAYRYEFLFLVQSVCTIEKQPVTRKEADDLFMGLCLEVNGMPVISGISWSLLRLFGSIAWNKNKN